jgi:hypothetical protein
VITKKQGERIRQESKNRCGYCLGQQRYILGILEIEHIYPKALGGSDDDENLWLACRMCNSHKADQTTGFDPITNDPISLFNPRTQNWNEHFEWSQDGIYVIGKTPCGRGTVIALDLNNELAVMVRTEWVMVKWHPPQE